MNHYGNNSNFIYRSNGGSLGREDPTYVIRAADQQFYQALKAKQFCYVFNCRQMGKSSLRVRTMHRLQQDGIACADIDLTGIVSQQTTPESWYLDIIRELVSCFSLKFDRRSWWQAQQDLTPVHRFEVFIEEILLQQVQQDIVIFVDEIDSVRRLSFQIDDFFQLIRACYEKRANNPLYQRLSWALLGVVTPSDLIKNPHSAPFNLGQAIELKGFQLDESLVLTKGLSDCADNPQQVLKRILYWTGGQPFLTQKVCSLVSASQQYIAKGKETLFVDLIVTEQLIDNWEEQDEPPHLKTIRSRILNTPHSQKLLQLYRQVVRWQGKFLAQTIFINQKLKQELQQELLLSGLVIKQGSYLKVYNPIYQAVFDQQWVKTQLQELKGEVQHLNLGLVGLVSTTVSCLVVALRWFALLQIPELQAFDHLMRRLPSEPIDKRLLIVGIDERDIEPELYGHPLSDQTLAQLLDKLQTYQPAAIGLDIIRDRPTPKSDVQGYQNWVTHLQNNHQLITICAFGKDPENTIKPPPQSRKEQRGFIDFFSDRSDDTMRRYLLSHQLFPESSSSCSTPYSLGWQLTYLYFDANNVPVTWKKNNWQFGEHLIKTLQPRSGGYQNLTTRGNQQLLINYRRTDDPQKIAPQLSLRDILSDRFSPDLVKNKIVLIGITASSIKDDHSTPLGKLRGLYIHAHTVSQILSAVENDRPLIWWLPVWGDILWITFWSGVGAMIVYWMRSPLYLIMSTGFAFIILYASCWLLLTQGGWLPLIPSVLALITSTSVLLIYKNVKLKDNW